MSSLNDLEKMPSSDLSDRMKRYESLYRQKGIEWVAERLFMKRLGVGGQGNVMLAERCGAASFRIPVALKFFSPAPFESVIRYDQEMDRLAEVSAIVARIQDDHLVAVHTFDRDDGIYFLEMEWIDGFDLLHILRRDTLDTVQEAMTERRWANFTERVITTGEVDCRLKPGMAIAILRECLAGISALHRGGVIHCDLKPSNVMVKRTGQVKIIDIGSAYWIGRPPEGQPCTLEYAAPEVLAGYRATPQSDLASLGYMLIEMLTGSKPFAGLSWSQLIEAKRDILDRLAAMLPLEEFQFSESLIRLLRRLMHPDPRMRFPTAEDAELSDDGAAGFLRELVKSDLGDEYASELRRWVAELEVVNAENSEPSEPANAEEQTTRISAEPGHSAAARTVLRTDAHRFDSGFELGPPMSD
ncbi:MAG: serine/threonine protein kinase [Planctomycetaceae bacterium]|nr:serine/threonine protein kinase [Planctomycetaceae bacterium]